jgi:hypothetical protein
VNTVAEFLRSIRVWFLPVKEEPPKPWLIDRDGTIYKPERRVVLKSSKEEKT